MSGDVEGVRLERTDGRSGGLRLVSIRAVNFATNSLMAHVPSFAARRAWYGTVLGIELGDHVGIFLGCRFWYYTPPQVRREGCRIGSNTIINRGCTLDLRGGLEIGENVSISPEVMILTAGHRMDDPGFPVELKRVVISDYVWVGSRAMIMPGVTLGRGSVVAAGAVVTRDVRPLAIVAGVPAREVRERAESGLGYRLDGDFPLFE
jgi:acetyltransferase-like isoleucine patch superfamily enzyme